MAEVEPQTSSKNAEFHHSAQTISTAIIGFILSVFLILIGLIILVRFWVFENILYNLFVLSFLVVGVVINIASVNLTLNEYPQSLHILPFLVGTPITLFWTLFCVIVPFFKQDFFSQFSQLPIATYDSGFYDGLGYNPKNTAVHPFAKQFTSENSIFENTALLIILLITLTGK